MSRNLSTAEVSRILGLKEARIREMVRSGLCRPSRSGRRYVFSFQDLVVLRAAKGLLDAKVPAARMRRSLTALARQLADDGSLAGVRIRADGRHVTVLREGSAWEPETGQTVLDFEVAGLARSMQDIREARGPASADAPPGPRARLEFARALDLEDDDPKAACQAYARALELDPDLVDAAVNLGRLSHEAGDAKEAARLYRLALDRGPEDPIVHFNLALALEDTAGPEQAASEYERALALDPEFADAHFNLAGLCEQLGRATLALRHYAAYRRLRDQS